MVFSHMVLLLVMWLLAACSGVTNEASSPPVSLEVNSLELRLLRDVDALAVEGFSGPGGTAFEVHVRMYVETNVGVCLSCVVRGGTVGLDCTPTVAVPTMIIVTEHTIDGSMFHSTV